MSVSQVRSPEGFIPSTTPGAAAAATVVGNAASIEGSPAKVTLNSVAIGAGALVLELPSALLYKGQVLLLDLTADAGNGITFAAGTGDTIANNPGAQVSPAAFLLLSDGSEWTFISGISV